MVEEVNDPMTPTTLRKQDARNRNNESSYTEATVVTKRLNKNLHGANNSVTLIGIAVDSLPANKQFGIKLITAQRECLYLWICYEESCLHSGDMIIAPTHRAWSQEPSKAPLEREPTFIMLNTLYQNQL